MIYKLKNGGILEVDGCSFFDVYSIEIYTHEKVGEVNDSEGWTFGTFIYDGNTEATITHYDEHGNLTGLTTEIHDGKVVE